MIGSYELRALLFSVSSRSISSKELERLVHITRSIAEIFLTHYRSRYQGLYEQSGLNFSDLATDCIAELFYMDGQDNFPRFEHFFERLPGGLVSIEPGELYFAFKSLVIKMAKARLARALAEIDPEGARLSRNIKETIKKMKGGIRLTSTPRGYLLHPKGVDHFESGKPFPLEVLEKELLQRASSDKIPEILENTAEILLSQDEYQKYIFLNDFVSVLKIYFTKLNIMNFPSAEIELSQIPERDLYLVKENALKAVEKKIVATYWEKISAEEAVKLAKTVESIVDGWISQREVTSSYAFHAMQVFCITEEEYRTRWRAKVEYLVKTAKKVFESYFLEDF